jgi:hypothetical protein
MTRKPNMNLVSLSWFPPTLPLDTKIAWNLSRKYTLTECCLVAKSTSMCIKKNYGIIFIIKSTWQYSITWQGTATTTYRRDGRPVPWSSASPSRCCHPELHTTWRSLAGGKKWNNKLYVYIYNYIYIIIYIYKKHTKKSKQQRIRRCRRIVDDVYWVTSDGMDDMRPTPDQSGPISNLRSECCDKVLNQRHLAQAHSSANFPLWHYHWIKERSPIWCGQIKKQMIQ